MIVRHGLLFTFLAILHSTTAQESCTTSQNKVGLCINIHSCQPLVQALQTQRPPSSTLLNYLTGLHCGFEGNDPKVCCEQQTSTTSTTTTERSTVLTIVPDPPDVSNHPNLQLVNSDLCGPASETKIIGGNKTDIFDFPWMALLAYDVGRSTPEFRCGGSLINKRYVLTAAHCVTALIGSIRLIGVRIGEHDLSSERDCSRDDNGVTIACAEQYQDFGIESVHFHPQYSRIKLQNDIALLRLDGDADFRPKNVKPICLPIGSAATLSFRTTKLTVTGWGGTETGRRSEKLLQAQLTPMSTEDCAETFKEKVQIWYKQLCAGGKKGVDSCPGDSGGPLQARTIYKNQVKFIQYGIVSFGLKNCGTEGFPGVYTNLVYYLDWILNTIRL